MKGKQAVAVDLDGVLAKYTSWDGVENIGNPIPGSQQFMMDLCRDYYVVVYTTRCSAAVNPPYSESELQGFVVAWLDKHKFLYDAVYVGKGKPLATAYIDDRAVVCRPQEGKNPHHAYNTALLRTKQLADITAAHADGDYVAELKRMGIDYYEVMGHVDG